MFMPWWHGFNVKDAMEKGEKLFQLTLAFPNIPSEFLSYLDKLGAQVGIPLDEKDTMANRLRRREGIPSIKVMVGSLQKLHRIVQIPLVGRGWLDQRIEYSGLPNQCYMCKGFGHLAKNYTRKGHDQSKGKNKKEENVPQPYANMEEQQIGSEVKDHAQRMGQE